MTAPGVPSSLPGAPAEVALRQRQRSLGPSFGNRGLCHGADGVKSLSPISPHGSGCPWSTKIPPLHAIRSTEQANSMMRVVQIFCPTTAVAALLDPRPCDGASLAEAKERKILGWSPGLDHFKILEEIRGLAVMAESPRIARPPISAGGETPPEMPCEEFREHVDALWLRPTGRRHPMDRALR